MNKLDLSAIQLAEMEELYRSQLLEARRRVNHLESVLEKISGTSKPSVDVVEVIEEAPAPVEVQTKEAAEVAKPAVVSYIPEEYIPKRGRGSKRPPERKSRWGTYIKNMLRTRGQLMTSAEMLETAMKRPGHAEKGEEKIKHSIHAALHRQTKINFRIRAIRVKGIQGLHYGMVGWFNADGSLKSPYDEQFGPLEYSIKEPSVSSPKETSHPTQKKRRGRPRKDSTELMAAVTPEKVFGTSAKPRRGRPPKKK